MADMKGRLRRFSEMDNVDIAEGDPDVRGWDVISNDGREIGEVEDLVVDPEAMKVRCLEVALDKKTYGLDQDRHVLLPIGSAQLDDEDDRVIVDVPSHDAIARLPEFSGEANETEYYRGFGDYGRDAAATRPLPERASGASGSTRRLIRAEEELRIRKHDEDPSHGGGR